MNTRDRLICGFLLLLVGLVGVGHARPQILADLGLAPSRESAEADLRRQEVAEQRSRARRLIARQVAQGEMSLFEAAAAFRFLNENPADCPECAPDVLAGKSEGEKLCRQVIQWVLTEQLMTPEAPLPLADDPLPYPPVPEGAPAVAPSTPVRPVPGPQQTETTRRLEEELREHIARNGTVVLPAR